MKVNENTLCVVVDSENYKQHHINHCKKYIENPDSLTYYRKMNFFFQKDFRTLILSQKSKENLKNYIVPKSIRLDVLKSLPNRKDIIQIDSNTCIKYWKLDNELYVTINYIYEKVANCDSIGLFYFRIDLRNGDIVIDDREFSKNSIDTIDKDKMIEKYYSQFLVAVTYLELTNVTLNIIKSGKVGGKHSTGKIKNDSPYKIIMVNTNWNTRTINLNSFSVRGHWRLQPCGKGLCKFKYVFINSYQKGLIRRLAQKEIYS